MLECYPMLPTLHGPSRIADQEQDLDVKAWVLDQRPGEVEPQSDCFDGLEGEERTQTVEEVRLPAVGLPELGPVRQAVGPQPGVVREQPLVHAAVAEVAV